MIGGRYGGCKPEGPAPDGPELALVIFVGLPARQETGPPGIPTHQWQNSTQQKDLKSEHRI
jgi:hypothetical protein